MKLLSLNIQEIKDTEIDTEIEDEESEIDELEKFVQSKLNNFGQSCNYTRLNTYGHDDVLGGK